MALIGYHGTTQDLVLLLDKLQGSPEGLTCPEKGHGKLTAHGSGQVLLCGSCEVHAKVDATILAAAQAFVEADRSKVFTALAPLHA